MKHMMDKKVKDQFERGRWYVDSDGEFHKFDRFSDTDNYGDTTMYTSRCYIDGEFGYSDDSLCFGYFDNKCTLMTLDDMKKYLPEDEWWVEPNNEFFPIY